MTRDRQDRMYGAMHNIICAQYVQYAENLICGLRTVIEAAGAWRQVHLWPSSAQLARAHGARGGECEVESRV